MSRMTVVAAVALVLIVGSVAWAKACPVCLKQIPEGQEYCELHQPDAKAAPVVAQDEKDLIDEMMRSRAAYVTSLERLRDYYRDIGHAEGMNRTRTMLRELHEGTALASRNWEDSEALPELNPTEAIPAADALLKDADALRISLNPFNHTKRLRKAAGKYQEILLKYPNSTAGPSAAFGLGEVYSSKAVKEYRRALKFYEKCWLADSNTPHDPIYRMAQVCDSDLADYPQAARYYWMATTIGRSVYTRKAAEIRLRQLQKRDFGTSYVIDDEASPAETESEPPATDQKPAEGE